MNLLSRVVFGLAVLFAGYALFVWLTDPFYAPAAAFDFHVYHDAAARWLAGGGFYHPWQLAGPYVTQIGDVMYPPIALVLFVPFIVLPAVLWWAIPLGVIAWRLVDLRPSPLGWAAIAVLVAYPVSLDRLFTGNPVMWIVALMALATRWPWVSALILLKPSLGPFALVGARTRAWWIALAGLGIASLLFLPMWADWFHVVTDARGFFSGPLYSLNDVPLMLVPVVAWLSRKQAGSQSV